MVARTVLTALPVDGTRPHAAREIIRTADPIFRTSVCIQILQNDASRAGMPSETLSNGMPSVMFI